MNLFDGSLDLNKLPGFLNSLQPPGNDFRPQLLAWVNEYTINKQIFVKRFPVEQKIGQGASSFIYKSGPQVVRVTKAKGTGVEIVDSLNRSRVETEIMESLQGSSLVVKLFETHIVGPNVCHIMENADAGSLYDHIPEKGMPVKRALACMQQIFSALAFIHKRGVVHYDLKPQNVLAFKNGQLKLTDFDTSLRVRDKVIDDYGDEVKKYIFGGSVAYMAPEIMTQENIGDIFKVDIYSAGKLFLMLLTNPRSFYSNPKQMIVETLQTNPYTTALRIEREVKGNSCKRCKSLFRYTLQRLPRTRKSAEWIVNRMTTWTWRPRRYGFDDQKSKTIVGDIVKLRF